MAEKIRDIKGEEIRSRAGVTDHHCTRSFQKKVLRRKQAAKVARRARKRNRKF